jgi:hypothetical protein
MFPEDPVVRFKKAYTSAILGGISKTAERSKYGKMAAEAFKSLGYNTDKLKNHIESQFTEGMTWDNYGKPDGDFYKGWHVDHIKPQCSFYFRSVEDAEFKECWGLENLRPLWALDNLKKAREDKKLSINKERKIWANHTKKEASYNPKSDPKKDLSLIIKDLSKFFSSYSSVSEKEKQHTKK